MAEEIKYNKCTKEELESYIDSIKATLRDRAPEWHVVLQSTSAPEQALYYHLARWDFSKGKDMTWDIPLNTWVFAYEEQGNEEAKRYILNLHPLEHKST